ncbi:helix-turn-helix transcriptional regulator [Prevotella sp. OH937_COT-195]|uniref:helix-turn-helix transcriptional regulator n=1 Tax=Prevotella sp. OH937_COT-195 TaxID=2491051 RepID=UPI000F651753|nr:helix-turn-helix transcriptional regulator [Prevotella sp. OH937_COT-195]RRD02758.1 LuxR family transcriptional regulator [Prevotella sp. OH937_COT-195]
MKEFPPVALFKKFVNERSHNKKEHIRLLVFMTGSLEIISIMILHLIGFIGLELPVLRLISCLSLLISLVFIVLYLNKWILLIRAFFTYSIIAQILESVRIVYLVIACPPDYETMVVCNHIGSYSILLYLALGFVPRASFYVLVMGLGSLFFTAFYGEGAIDPQFVILFLVLNISTYLLSVIIQHGVRDMQREKNSFKSFRTNILRTLHITQEELDAFLELCEDRKPYEKYEPLLFGLLDERKKHNFLRAVDKLQKKHAAEQQDFARKFPMLSKVELEICRLVAYGKPVSEIAIITGKSISNVSTVRGNIRKKLGLDRNTDLRAFLVKDDKEKNSEV